MSAKPPKPLCPTFVICRRVIKDQFSKEAVLIAPVYAVNAASFPTLIDLAIYLRLTDGNGSYQLGLQLFSAEGPKAWSEPLRGKIEMPNPLTSVALEIPMMRVYIPYPGKFEMLLLANDEEVYRTDLLVKTLAPAPPPQAPAESE
jgi:hypothetical protein